MEITGLIDIIILGCGIYSLYSCIMMKSTGEINKTILLGKDIEAKDCRDKEGYIKYMTPRFLVFSLATIVYGGVSVLNSYVIDIGNAVYALMAVFLIFVIWFAVETKNAFKKFFA